MKMSEIHEAYAKGDLKPIETLTLRDYIDKTIGELRAECLQLFRDDRGAENIAEIMCKNARMVILQEIAYRLEYGFITEIGDTSLKHRLSQI
jgi:hypothetical protein